MKKLIINADDFGKTDLVNLGIVESFKEGIVSDTSVLVNTKGFEHALKLIKKFKVPCGLHLNITEGKPICNPKSIKSLVDKKGNFLGIKKFLIKYFLGLISKKHIEKEIKAQIAKAKNNLNIEHIDSHHHVHMFRGIFPIFLKISKDYGINKIRVVHFPLNFLRKFLEKGFHKTFIIKVLSYNKKKIEGILGKYNFFVYPEHFYGLSIEYSPSLNSFEKIIRNLKGTSEIMVHPGYFEKIDKREKEIRILTNKNLKKLIKEQNIKLISYKNL